MAKIWLVDVCSSFVDAVLLVLDMAGMDVVLGLGATRLVIYAVQLVAALLLVGRPHPRSAYFYEAPQFCGASALMHICWVVI